jgi:hypothetical protein
MAKSGYNMSFSLGGLFFIESLRVAEIYMEKKDWNLARDKVLTNNILQARTKSSLKRVTREVISRLRLLTGNQIKLLVTGSRQEQNFLFWLGVCKRHEFIKDFAVEVIREKYLRFNYELTHQDYDIFYNHKSEWHPELEKLSEKTQKKLRQVLFKIIREAELLTSEGMIVPVFFTEYLAKVIIKDNVSWFNIYPISDLDIGKWVKQ